MISDEIVEQVCKGYRGWDLVIGEYDLPDGTSVYSFGFDVSDDEEIPLVTPPMGVVDTGGKLRIVMGLTREWGGLMQSIDGLDPVDERHVPHES